MRNIVFVIVLLSFLLAPFSGLYDTRWIDLLFFQLPLLAFVLLITGREKAEQPLYIPPGTGAVLLLIMTGLVQLIPLPAQLIRSLSPKAWEIYRETAGVLKPDIWMTLTLAPKNTLHVVFSLVSCCAGYFVAANVLADRGRLKIAAMSLAALGGGLGGTIIILRFLNLQRTSSGATVLAGGSSPAITAVMILVCAISLALFLAERPAIHYGTLRERIADFFANPREKKHFIFGVPGVFIPLALAMYCPAVLPILVLSLLLFLIFMGLRGRGRSEVPWLMVYLVLVFALTLFSVHKDVPSANDLGRAAPEVHAVSREILRDFTVTGSGFGTISALAPRYRLTMEPGIGAGQVVRGIFNLAAQGGLLSAVIFGWLSVGFLVPTFVLWRRRRNKLAVYLYAAALSGLVAFGICLLLFPFRNHTAFPLLLFLAAGLTAAAAKPEIRERKSSGLRPQIRRMALMLICAFIFFGGFFYLGDLAARGLQRDFGENGVDAMEPDRYRLVRSARCDPFNPQYRYDLGYQALDSGDLLLAREHFVRALRLDPQNGNAIYGLAQAFLASGEQAIARQLVSAAMKTNPDSREILLGHVSRLLKTKNLPKALESIRSFLEVNSSDTLFWLEYLVSSGFDLHELTGILPDLSRSWYDYGQYLLQRGDRSGAAKAFHQAITLAEKEEMPDKTLFLTIARIFEKQKSYEDALDVLLAGGRKYPEEKSFLSSTARIYLEMGISFKAIELYRKILILDPADRMAREQLNRLESSL